MDFQSEDKLPIQGNVQPPTPIPNPMNEMAQSGPMMMQPHNPMMGAYAPYPAYSPYPGMAPQQVMPQQVMAQQVMAQQVMAQQMTAPVMMPSGVYPMGGQLNGYA